MICVWVGATAVKGNRVVYVGYLRNGRRHNPHKRRLKIGATLSVVGTTVSRDRVFLRCLTLKKKGVR